MTLAAGSKLGPYEILAPLGAGGMGEVYRARDPRLGRDVAIKVSSAQFSERFEREARAIATLNHPHICQIYDVGENYIVMELIEGVPLKGPLPLDTALKYAGQICEALEAAHKKAIVHRDLKPANILVTKTGVKLLDFGLAKLGPAVQAAQEATVTMALTGKNEIVGTLYYMSPEQLQAQPDGREVDGRSDIFSFGLVLYEMLTGKRAMEGASAASVIAAIMERPAPSIAEVAPLALDRVLKRCLEKDPEQRWQSALDVKSALDLATITPAAAPPQKGRWLWAAAAAVIAVGASYVGWRFGGSGPEAEGRVVRFQIPVQPSQGLRPLGAISPDGLSLAYFDALENGRLGLKLRTIASAEIREFPEGEMAQPTLLFWSPDSSTVYFGNRRFVRQVEVSRGIVEKVCDCSSDSGTVNQDGLILLGATPGRPDIVSVKAGSGVTTVRKGTDATPTEPVFLPDGKRFLFREGAELFVASLDRPEEARRLIGAPGRIAFAPGFLLVVQPNGLQVFPFDAEKAEISGAAMDLPLGGSEPRDPLSVSQDGLLLRLVSVELGQDLMWFDAQGKRLGRLESVDGYAGMDLSHDGSRMAVIESSQKLGGFRIRDLARGTATRLAQSLRPEGTVLWSPDDQSVVFVARDGKGGRYDRGHRMYRADTDAARPESLLLDEPGLHWPNDWSRDGKYLLYGFDEGKTYRDLWALPMDQPGAKPFQVTRGNSLIKEGAFSPDAAYIAYTSDESGQYEIYVQPFPDTSKGKWVISKDGGTEPIWSRDGRKLYFFSGQKMMYVDIRTGAGGFAAGAPQELFSAPVPSGYSNDSHRWQLSPDGRQFLVMVPASGRATAQLDVIVNWEELLPR